LEAEVILDIRVCPLCSSPSSELTITAHRHTSHSPDLTFLKIWLYNSSVGIEKEGKECKMEDFLTAIIVLFTPFILFFVIVTIARIIHGGLLPISNTDYIKGDDSLKKMDLFNGRHKYNPFMMGTMAWHAMGKNNHKAGKV